MASQKRGSINEGYDIGGSMLLGQYEDMDLPVSRMSLDVSAIEKESQLENKTGADGHISSSGTRARSLQNTQFSI